MPARGFHYFQSPDDRDDDSEVIAHEFFYCSTAVEQWPAFRQHLEATGRSRQQCDDIEKNAIEIFRQVKDGMVRSLETDNWDFWPSPGLLQRLVLAHAYLALHADPAGMAGYQRMVLAQAGTRALDGLPGVEAFTLALWGGSWNRDSDDMPSRTTARQTRRIARAFLRDGIYNTENTTGNALGRPPRRDAVARALQETAVSENGEYVNLLETGQSKAAIPSNRATEFEFLRPLADVSNSTLLAPMKSAFTEEAARHVFLQAGLKRRHATFGVRFCFGRAKKSDDQSAWRAILKKKDAIRAQLHRLLSPSS